MDRTPDQIDDELLVLRVRGRGRDAAAALEALVIRWQARILAVARRLTGDADGAHDVVQEAWIDIARQTGRLRDPAHFGALAVKIVARRSADWIRKRQRSRRLESIAIEKARNDQRETNPESSDEVQRLRNALASLPPDRRLILAMHYLDGLGVAEIGAALDVPAGTVKSRLYAARESLRAVLERSTV